MIELARYQEGPSHVVVYRDGEELGFTSSYDDYGRTITEGYRAGDVADVIDILRGGGAAATDRHRGLAATAGASQVEAALRR